MPPLPTTFDVDALALLEAIERRQNDLTTFQIPRLKTCTGPLVIQQAWAAEVREDVEQLATQIEELGVCVEDQRTERGRRELRATVDGRLKALDTLRKDARAAVLASKRAIDAQSRSQREELLRSSVIRDKGPSNEKLTDDVLMKTNNDVTEALQRTIGLMQKELERSVLSTQLLESSTSTLNSTSTTHSTLNLLLGTSRQLVTALEHTDWLDRVLIIAALVLFALVVLFVVKERILDRGVRIAFWWTRFLPGGRVGAGDKSKYALAEKGAGVLAGLSASESASATVAVLVAASQEAASLMSATTTQIPEVLDNVLPPTVEVRTADTVGAHTPVRVRVEL
ncbi:hypothetical protein PAXRUDRAFT_829049 [Paxillus rubicundulus Ve08.2h10]|uniref:Sec20 C-terminal domain-containing protein n=1 Tax=Paxillus rubicundulus Ve08.2h10 TaxID=930991 RepID=A0A0D0E0J9_9AGAM|nr:hypothetical protein PAXRUDRAFT_829049 [Paxillus rubicundulus Ve08.2h10]